MVKKFHFRGDLLLKVLVIALVISLFVTNIVHAILENHKLSGGNISGGDVMGDFKISPNGRYTVFSGDIRINGRVELFSVPTLGGERVLLLQDMPSGCYVDKFLISPDSQFVVYSTIDWLETAHCGLYSVPIGGGSSIELDPASSRELVKFIITGDSEYVLFNFWYRSSVYRVPIRGGERFPLIEEIQGDLGYFVTPDNQAVVVSQYTHDESPHKILYYNLEEEEPVILVEFEPDDYLGLVRLTPDGDYVIYDVTIDSEQELYSLHIDSRTEAQLNLPMVSDVHIYQFYITPDSNHVVYKADETVNGMDLLYSVPVNGSSERIPLLPTSFADPMKDVGYFRIAPNSQWVVFEGDLNVNDRSDLFSASIDGTEYHCLTDGMDANGDVIVFRIAPDSSGVVVLVDYNEAEVNELFAVNMDGTQGARLNLPLIENGDVLDFKILNNSQGVIYRADQEEDEVINLYGAFPAADGVVVFQLNPYLASGGDVGSSYQVTPDDKGVIYLADQELDEVRELFLTYDYQKLYLPMVTK